MKAVVTEVKDGQMTLLTEDWIVIEMEGAYAVGEEIEIPDAPKAAEGTKKRPVRFSRYIAAAAAVLLAVMVGAGTYTTTVYAASSVSVDSEDASVTLSLNRLGRVIGISASGSEAEDLVKSLYADGIRNDTLPEAIGKVSRRMKDRGYMEEGDRPGIELHAENEKTYDKLRTELEGEGLSIGPGEKRKKESDENAQQEDQTESVGTAEPKNDLRPEEKEEPEDQHVPADHTEQEPEKQESEMQEPERQESEKQEPERQESKKQEPERQESEKQEPEKQESPAEIYQEPGPEPAGERPQEQIGEQEQHREQEPPEQNSFENDMPQIQPGEEPPESGLSEQPGPGYGSGSHDPEAPPENNPGREGGNPMTGGDHAPPGDR